MSLIEKPDHVHKIIDGKLWQSGCYVRRADIPNVDAIIAVGDAHGPRDPDGTEWWKEWVSDLSRVHEGNCERPIMIHAPLLDMHRPGMLDRPAADGVARFGAYLLRRGRKVLVHCDAGMFRSVLVAALVVHHFTGCSGEDARALVYRAHGRPEKEKIGLPDFDALLASCSTDRRLP